LCASRKEEKNKSNNKMKVENKIYYRRSNMNFGGTNLEKDEVADSFYINVVSVLVQK
jgi:hypothetical protein